MEKNVDLTMKNKKGQTPIDITSSKTIINLFWNYLKKSNSSAKENKALLSPSHSPKKAISKKCSAKIPIKNIQKYNGESSNLGAIPVSVNALLSNIRMEVKVLRRREKLSLRVQFKQLVVAN